MCTSSKIEKVLYLLVDYALVTCKHVMIMETVAAININIVSLVLRQVPVVWASHLQTIMKTKIVEVNA